MYKNINKFHYKDPFVKFMYMSAFS